MKKVIIHIRRFDYIYNIHYRYQDPKLIDNKIHKRYSFFYFSVFKSCSSCQISFTSGVIRYNKLFSIFNFSNSHHV